MADAPLVVDRREEMGAAPGFHALLIGVSDYTNLTAPDEPPGDGLEALQKLDFAALGAFRLAEKLIALDAAGRLPRRLKTARLLVAPSDTEAAAVPGIAEGAESPTFQAISVALHAWRRDVAVSRDEIAFFYFGGHGVRQALEESVLLAADLLDPAGGPLDRAFRLSNLRNGMAPSAEYPDIGRDQFYFVDACRDRPAGLERIDDAACGTIWDVALNGVDYRRAPLFLSTPPGGVSAGETGGTTYFVEAMLWALDNGAYRREILPGSSGKVWPVRATSLKDGLEAYGRSFEGSVELTGLISDPILCHAIDPPRLTLRIGIGPDAARAGIMAAALTPMAGGDAAVIVSDAEGDTPCRVIDLAAGLYKLSLSPRNEAFGAFESEFEQIHVGFTMPWLVELSS